jgi:LysM repeat protein
MSGKGSPRSVIESYKRRQQMMPFLIGGLAIVLVVVGIIILVAWFSKSGKPVTLFATQTPTATLTFTPTPVTPTATQTVTLTPTITDTVAPTFTPTQAGPMQYTVKENDTCWGIAQQFKVDLLVLLAVNNFAPNTCPIKMNDVILIPMPGQVLPSPTPLPSDIAPGTRIEYYVQTGDTLAIIAQRFDSTVERIMQVNNLKDANTIQLGQKLIIPVRIITATPTRQPTFTPIAVTPILVTLPPTATPTP